MPISSSLSWSAARCFAPLLLTSIVTIGVAQAQSDSKNRKDEKRENQKVEQTRREWTQSQLELKRLQDEWEGKHREYLEARSKVIEAKRNLELAREREEERLGKELGIREQMELVQSKGSEYRTLSQPVLDRVRAANTWKEKQERIEAIEEKLTLGSDPTTELPMSSDDLESLEKELASQKTQLRSIEDATIDRDPDASKAKQAWQAAQAELETLRRKLDQEQIDRSPACKRAQSELDQVSRKMQTATAAMDRFGDAVQKKARELGSDYAAYLKAKRADAADSNRNKPPPSKKK